MKNKPKLEDGHVYICPIVKRRFNLTVLKRFLLNSVFLPEEIVWFDKNTKRVIVDVKKFKRSKDDSCLEFHNLNARIVLGGFHTKFYTKDKLIQKGLYNDSNNH